MAAGAFPWLLDGRLGEALTRQINAKLTIRWAQSRKRTFKVIKIGPKPTDNLKNKATEEKNLSFVQASWHQAHIYPNSILFVWRCGLS
jgi:hypothetical protein